MKRKVYMPCARKRVNRGERDMEIGRRETSRTACMQGATRTSTDAEEQEEPYFMQTNDMNDNARGEG